MGANEKPYTFADLKAELDAMTPEQLAYPVICAYKETSGPLLSIRVTEEDQVCSDDYWEPRSEFIENAKLSRLTQEEAEAQPIVMFKSQPYLCVD